MNMNSFHQIFEWIARKSAEIVHLRKTCIFLSDTVWLKPKYKMQFTAKLELFPNFCVQLDYINKKKT